MVWLKECPRCQGDLFLDKDCYGKFKTCVQCGYMKDLEDATVGGAPLIASATTPGGLSFKEFSAMLAAAD